MSLFLDYLNQQFSDKTFENWHIDDILFDCYLFPNDELSAIFNNHNVISNYEKIETSNETALSLKKYYSDKNNILINSLIDFLLSCCKKYRNESNLVCDLKCFIELYFKNINCSGLAIHNLATLFKWTIYKFPEYKFELKQLIISKLNMSSLEKIDAAIFVAYFIEDNKLYSLFNIDDYEMFYNKHIPPLDIQQKNVLFWLEYIKKYLNTPLGKIKKHKLKIKHDLCIFVINNIYLLDNYTKQIELQLIRNYMDELNIFDNSSYKLIDDELDKANKWALSKLDNYNIELPVEFHDYYNKNIEFFKNIFDYMPNDKKLNYILFNAEPLSVSNIQKHISNKKSSLIGYVNNLFLDNSGRVINYKHLNCKEQFSLDAREIVGITINIFFDLLYNQFKNSFVLDENAKKYVRSILENNMLVTSTRINYLSNLFYTFFSGDFENSCFNIVEELEPSLRYYLKNQGLNIIKKNSSGHFIDINYIFNNNEQNSYRDKLCEIIDDDYYFTLKWMLTDEYGFNLRNKISHRIDSTNLSYARYSIYAVLLIFKLYLGFQNNEMLK